MENPTYHHLGDHSESIQIDFDPQRRQSARNALAVIDDIGAIAIGIDDDERPTEAVRTERPEDAVAVVNRDHRSARHDSSRHNRHDRR